ncbi:hypothetical protein GW17_00014036 [Ensete ventricosum]|nr:hypothetical protein GW17_00014036 [Ensete ventricosum]RZS13690.1 hypothetical protein BHM03_00045308 [Ensete ventricosum]
MLSYLLRLLVSSSLQDFLGLVEKFYYLSGRYEIELAIGDAAMLLRLGVNFKGFPSSSVPVLFSILFHAGIAAVLLLYGLFWLKVLYRFPS